MATSAVNFFVKTTEGHSLPRNVVSKTDYSFIWIYISPFILFIGTVGNSLILCVMSRRSLRHSTTRIYLSAMAVGDTCALFWRITPEILRASKSFDFSSLNEWTCRMEHFSFYTSSDAAIWFMVSFTLDRLVAVCLPLHKKRICKKKTARLVVMSVLSTAIVKNIHVFWTRGFESRFDLHFRHNFSEVISLTSTNFVSTTPFTAKIVKPSCRRLLYYSFYEEKVRPWLAFTFVSLLPTIVLIVCNVLIVRTLLKIYRFRQTALEGCQRENKMRLFCQPSVHKQMEVHFFESRENEGPDNHRKLSSASTNRVSSGTTSKKYTFTHASLMCISVSLMFLICVAPSIILTIGRRTWEGFKHYDLVKAANNQLACLNHAGNFFLYCLTGERFRCELLVMLRLRKSAAGHEKYRLHTSPSLRTVELLNNKKT